MDIEQYKQYAKERRNKSKLACCYDKGVLYIKQNNLPYGMNGGTSSDAYGNPYLHECVVGHGTTNKDGKVWFTENMYRIIFYSGNKGTTIYKSSAESINYKCFVCGGSPEMFGSTFFEKGCRVYERLEVEEVLSMLVNKDICRFKNITKNNPYNIQFLKLMQKRLIKSLEYNNIIHWVEPLKKYVEYNFYKTFYKNF